MRLIDADAIYYKRIYIPIGDGTYHRDLIIFKCDIDAQPTIDAIPVDWIEKKIKYIRQYLENCEGEPFTDGLRSKVIAYEKLIEDWRKEHDKTD